jgi:hypothetical protein
MEDSSIATAPPVPATKKPAKKPKQVKAPSKIRLQLYFDKDVRMDLEHWCIDKNVTMSDYVNALVAKTVPKRKR